MADSIRTLDTLEMIGGKPCLDFVNTINSRLAPEHDYLRTYSDLIGWATRASLLTSAQAYQLNERTRQVPAEAEKALQAALAARDLLYAILAAAARHVEPGDRDLSAFVSLYAEAVSHSQLSRSEGMYAPRWESEQSCSSILWPIVYSAGEVLLSGSLAQVKECPGCGWLFLDTSKNQTRRWCSMNTCGARSKMRRYHGRLRAN